MGGYSYKKRNKAVKQSFKNRRSSPRNINIMIGGEEPVDEEEAEMVGGATPIEDITAGFAAIDNYFKTVLIPKDVNTVYIEKNGSDVEVLTRATTPAAAAVNPTTPTAIPLAPLATVNPAGAGVIKPNVNTNANIALSIADVIQKAFTALTESKTLPKKGTTNVAIVAANGAAIAATEIASIAFTTAAESAKNKNQFIQPELIAVINATLKVIKQGHNITIVKELTTALNNLNTALNKLP